MAKGGRRQYTRDARGRFSGGGGGGASRPAAQKVKRGTNRLTRDNAGRITSAGGEGATARGGRLRTAGGNLRATQTAKIKSSAARANTIAKGGRGVRGSVARSMAAMRAAKATASAKPVPAAKSADRKRIRNTESAVKSTKAERVITRIEGNQARGTTVARSKKEDRRLAKTLAVSQFAKSYVSNRAVGSRDPNKQYTKAELLPQLNRALSRPTPKSKKKSTRSNDPEKGLLALATSAALKARAKYRAQGLLLPAPSKPRRRKPK